MPFGGYPTVANVKQRINQLRSKSPVVGIVRSVADKVRSVFPASGRMRIFGDSSLLDFADYDTGGTNTSRSTPPLQPGDIYSSVK